jgi:Tfp pilus assembly protein PilO
MPKSTGERLWWIGGGLGAFLLVLVGWFFLISPQRARTSGIEGQVSAARQQNTGLQARINSLREQNAHLAKYQAALRHAQLALPNQSGASDFLRTLQKIGNDTSTQLAQWNFGAPVAINMTPTAAAGAPAPTTTAPTTTAAPAAAGPPKPAAGVYAVPLTLQVTGSPAALGQFLEQLQAAQPRAVLITKLIEGGSTTTAKTSGTSLQLSMQAFVDTAQVPVPTPSAATPSASPTATP